MAIVGENGNLIMIKKNPQQLCLAKQNLSDSRERKKLKLDVNEYLGAVHNNKGSVGG